MIETVDLTKKYGDFFALESLTLKLEKGDLIWLYRSKWCGENNDH